MSFTNSTDGACIHYEVHGAGEPVLLIMGLGSNAYGWARTIPWLAKLAAIIYNVARLAQLRDVGIVPAQNGKTDGIILPAIDAQ